MITTTLTKIAAFFKVRSRPCGGRGVAIAEVALGSVFSEDGYFLAHQDMKASGGAVRMCEACVEQAFRFSRTYHRPIKVDYFNGLTVIFDGYGENKEATSEKQPSPVHGT